MVHNLICGALTCVGDGTEPPLYALPHSSPYGGHGLYDASSTAMTVSTIIFSSRNGLPEDFVTIRDSSEGFDTENRKAGTWVFDGYPTYEEWIAQFDFSKPADMAETLSRSRGSSPGLERGKRLL